MDVLSQLKPQASTVATTPSGLVLGGSSSIGNSTDYARANHGHSLPIPAPTIGGVLGTDGSSALWAPSDVENVLINGSFEIAQQGTATLNPAVSGLRYLDMWTWSQAGPGVFAITPATSPTSVVVAGYPPLSSYVAWQVQTAEASLGSGSLYQCYQAIEGWNARKLVNGCAFSGLFYSTRGGRFGIGLQNRGITYSCIQEMVLSANTWTPFTCVFPAMPSAAIAGDLRTQIGLYFEITLAAGSTYQTSTLGTWQNANRLMPNTGTNNADTVGAYLYAANLNLIPGSVPMPYQPLDYALEFARCMRYRQIRPTTGSNPAVGNGWSNAATTAYITVPFPVPMVGTPSFAVNAATSWNLWDAVSGFNCTQISLSFTNPWTVTLLCTAGGGGMTARAPCLLYSNGGTMTFEALPT